MPEIPVDNSIALFVAQVAGQLKNIDKNTVEGRSNPATKIDPYDFLKKGNTPPQTRTTIPTKINIPENIDPKLAPPPLDEILIPLPNDLKGKDDQSIIPTTQPPNKTGSTQLELPLTITPNLNIPQTPKEMFEYFKERLDMIESKLTGVIMLIKEKKVKKYKKIGAEKTND